MITSIQRQLKLPQTAHQSIARLEKLKKENRELAQSIHDIYTILCSEESMDNFLNEVEGAEKSVLINFVIADILYLNERFRRKVDGKTKIFLGKTAGIEVQEQDESTLCAIDWDFTADIISSHPVAMQDFWLSLDRVIQKSSSKYHDSLSLACIDIITIRRVETNIEEIFETIENYLLNAKDKDDPIIPYNLGALYMEKSSHVKRGLDLLKESFNNGFKSAGTLLSSIYQKGCSGVDRDLKEASKFFWPLRASELSERIESTLDYLDEMFSDLPQDFALKIKASNSQECLDELYYANHYAEEYDEAKTFLHLFRVSTFVPEMRDHINFNKLNHRVDISGMRVDEVLELMDNVKLIGNNSHRALEIRNDNFEVSELMQIYKKFDDIERVKSHHRLFQNIFEFVTKKISFDAFGEERETEFVATASEGRGSLAFHIRAPMREEDRSFSSVMTYFSDVFHNRDQRRIAPLCETKGNIDTLQYSLVLDRNGNARVLINLLPENNVSLVSEQDADVLGDNSEEPRVRRESESNLSDVSEDTISSEQDVDVPGYSPEQPRVRRESEGNLSYDSGDTVFTL